MGLGREELSTTSIPHHHEVLHHLLAEVVIDTVDLLLLEEAAEVLAQLGRAGRVLAKRLLHNDTIPATEDAGNRQK